MGLDEWPRKTALPEEISLPARWMWEWPRRLSRLVGLARIDLVRRTRDDHFARSLEPALPRTIVLTDPDQFNDIREGVRAVCAKFPEKYHRKINNDRAYPEAFLAQILRVSRRIRRTVSSRSDLMVAKLN